MKMPTLIKLNARDDWSKIIEQSQLIYGTPEYPKVCRTNDGFILKWFYPRGGISSDRFFPYAKRFIKHAFQLDQKGIESVHVQGWLFDPQTQAYIVIYPEIDGMTVRQAMMSNMAEIVMDSFVDFIVELHERGVFFRGIHLANVLVREVATPESETAEVTPQLSFSLIDITDCRVKHNKLNRLERLRNIKHMLSNIEDSAIFAAYGVERFLERYTELTGVEIPLSAKSQPAQQSHEQHQAEKMAAQDEYCVLTSNHE